MESITLGPYATVALAFFVAACTAVSPVVMAWLTNRNRRQEKLEDYARQDAVASKAAEAARLLADRQDQAAAKAAEAARLLLASNERVAATSKVTNSKLDVIHTLVNSNMTTALQSELDAVMRELAMMKEVIALKRVAGQEPLIDALAAVKSTEEKIIELRAALADRTKTAMTVQSS